MKEKYTNLEAEVVLFESSDVITTSGVNLDEEDFEDNF